MAKQDLKEEAKVILAKARIEYAQISSKITKARRLLPPESERTPEEITFWMMLCKKASNCAKAVKEAEQRFNSFNSAPSTNTNTLDRLQELMATVDFAQEKEQVEKELNPKKKNILDIPWARTIATAAAIHKPTSGENPLAGKVEFAEELKEIEERNKALDNWLNSPSPEPQIRESKEIEDESISSVEQEKE